MKRHLQNNHRTSCDSERGAVLILVAITVFVIVGMIGLAMDGGHLYAAKQRAQAAADAAAQAAAMDLYNGKSTDVATGSANWYAQQNGFNTPGDTIAVTYPACPGLSWCNGHVALSGIDTPNLVEVTVSRTVNTTLIGVLGLKAASVSATADAAIVVAPAPLPIIVTHPTLDNVVDTGGNKSVIQVCGGPQRSLQINSNSPTALNNPGIDLSHAGPLSDGSCADPVTGGDLAVVGGPATLPGHVNLGVDGSYQEPASVVPDPFINVSPPSKPLDAPLPTTVPGGQNGCPAGKGSTCALYSPGNYPGGIDVKNQTALFKPGIYYISSGGFTNEANGTMLMATGFTDPVTGTGMLVYNTGSTYAPFTFAANSNASLIGSPQDSVYEGMLFFQDRSSPSLNHTIWAGGSITLTGTIYITNTLAMMQGGQYQTLTFGGNAGSTTQVIGEIVTSAIKMNGGTTLVMHLTGTPTRDVRQVALVR